MVVSTVFANFVKAFNQFKAESNLSSLSYAEARAYGWQLGVDLRDELIKHVDEEWPDAPEDLRNNFHLMFEVDNDFMGIPILTHLTGQHAESIYLLKISTKAVTGKLADVAFKASTVIGDGVPTVTSPVTGKRLRWVCALEIQSLTVTGTSGEFTDSMEVDYRGSLVNKAYSTGQLKVNEQDGVSVTGSVNYRTGEVWVSRSSDANINLLDKLITEYGSSSSSSGSSSSGGSSSGSSTPKPKPKKETETYTVAGTQYCAPVKLLWTHSMSST